MRAAKPALHVAHRLRKAKSARAKAAMHADKHASLIKTATVVCEERLDIAGFNMEDVTIEYVTGPDRGGSVCFQVTVWVNDLDIEIARAEGK